MGTSSDQWNVVSGASDAKNILVFGDIFIDANTRLYVRLYFLKWAWKASFIQDAHSCGHIDDERSPLDSNGPKRQSSRIRFWRSSKQSHLRANFSAAL